MLLLLHDQKLLSRLIMATTAGGSFSAWSRLSSYSSHKARTTKASSSLVFNIVHLQRRNLSCLAVKQESSTSTVAETKEQKDVKEANGDSSESKVKSKAPSKAPAKSLSEVMEEEVIPSLKTTLEAQQDIAELNLSFGDNKLEGSFFNKGIPYSFWALFPDGTINGPKGFSISAYGAAVSTVEPFLVDEKKPTAKLFVFWVEKRLAAQGIIPVWSKDDTITIQT